MRRRALLRGAGLLAAAGAAAGIPRPVQGQQNAPNVVLIVADDLDARLGTLDLMPRIQQHMVSRGVTFTNAVANCPLCTPSRASILTGLYAHHHGVLGNNPGFATYRERGLEASALPALLRAAGYRTAIYGKYMSGFTHEHGRQGGLPGWNESGVIVGWPSYYDYTLSLNGTLSAFGHTEWNYLTDVLARRSAAFVERNAATPFFLYVPVYAPHAPAGVEPQDAGKLAALTAPRDGSVNEADVSDKPAHIRNLPLLSEAELAQADRLQRDRARCLLSVGRLVQTIDDALDAAGLTQNTYVVFTSDNGFHLGQHRSLRGKGLPYEEDINVPLIIRGPGIQEGGTDDRLVSLVDLAPTILGWCGVAVPAAMDGRSLAGDAGRQLLPVSMDDPQSIGYIAMPAWRALRFAGAKYVEYATGERELYDLDTDPFEVTNRYDGEMGMVREWLHGWLEDVFRA